MGDSEFEGVRPASKTTIEIDFYYRGVRCRERLKLKPTPANLRRAKAHRGSVIDAIERGTFDYAVTFPNSKNASRFQKQVATTDSTINEYMSLWLQDIKQSLKRSTWVIYRRIVNHQIADAVGDMLIGDLEWRHIKTWLSQKEASKKTKDNILSVLRTALDDAVDDGLLLYNPVAGHKNRRDNSKPKTDEIDPFDAGERAAILKEAKGQEHNLIQFAFWTGLRISELCALDWNDVDWVDNQVYIQRALTQHAQEPETTKTAAGRRFVKLLPAALEALTAQKAHTYLQGEAIFHNPRTGERWTGDMVIRKRMWTRILKRAGVRYRYPQQMRHTYASMMLQAGESVMWVSKQMGHTSWAFTARTYSRWVSLDSPDAGEKAAARWGENADQNVDHARPKSTKAD